MYLTVTNIKKRKVKYFVNIRAGTLKRYLNYNGTYIAFNADYRIIKK